MQPNGLGIDLSPEHLQQIPSHRRPLPTVPNAGLPPRPTADRKTTFSDKSPSVIGFSVVDEYDDDSDEDQHELSNVSEVTEEEPDQQSLAPPPHVIRARLNHRRSASIDLTNFNPQATGHGLQAANPAHLRVRSQYSSDLVPPQRTLGRPKSMGELPHLPPHRSNYAPQYQQSSGVASFLRQQQADYPEPSSPSSTSNPYPNVRSSETLKSVSPSQQAMAQAHLLKAKSELNLRAAARSQSPTYSGKSGMSFDPSANPFTLDTQPSREETVLASPSVVGNEFNDAHPEADPESLKRNSTLLSGGNANTVRRQKELSRILAPEHNRIVHGTPLKKEGGKALQRKPSAPVTLEQAKNSGKARVELDVTLESGLVVEGGLLKGRMEVKVKAGGEPVWMGAPKVRIVGFEELASGDARHIFYHHAATISDMPSPFSNTKERYPLPCFEGQADEEGYYQAARGVCGFPMNLRLPIGKGAKGSYKSKAGEVRYIVIGSIKLKARDGSQRSIAHFYRHIDVFPYCDPTSTLRSLDEPLRSSSSKTMFMGGEGKVALTATIHRSNWIAGQQCYIGVEVKNESSKKIKSMTLTLVRLTTTFRPRPQAQEVDTEVCQTQTNKKKVAETTLESGKKATKGDVTAKGNWLGVDKGTSAEFMHPLLVPTDALSISKGKHLEVSYVVRVAVSASLGSDLVVEIPITIHNFVSMDPPPGHLASFTWNTMGSETAGSEMSSPPKLSRQSSDVGLEGNTAGHGRPERGLNHRSSFEFISNTIANASRPRPHRAVRRATSLDEIAERSPSSFEETASEAEWDARHRILPLPEDNEEESEGDASVDEIETVLSLERPLSSPALSAVPGFPPQQRPTDGQPKVAVTPPQLQPFAFPSSNSPVRSRVSPEVRRKSMGPLPPSPRRVSQAANKTLPALKASPGSLRAHVVTSPEESQGLNHVDQWLKSSVAASVGSRSPSSSHATLASPHSKLLTPFHTSPGTYDRSPRSSPEPGLSPSEGYSTPSTVMAVTPPPEDREDERYAETQVDDTVTLSIPQTPKHMLKPASPHLRTNSYDSGVRSRVAALETLGSASSLRKAPSLYSDVSDASFKRMVRTQSTTSFKAPIWRHA